MSETDSALRTARLRRFSLQCAIGATILAAIPFLIGLALTGPGELYLQQQMAVDDQMVYAAWMKQAASGSILFENLFAIERQPGLTLHLYFLVLGWISKLTGIPLALTIARLGFTFLFVILLGRFLERLEHGIFGAKFAMLFAGIGGGLGWLAWEPFGRVITTEGNPIGALTSGYLPIDVWQTEAFGFPSMLVNGLFMASLCLIITILSSVLDAQEGWKPVLPGAAAMLVLMNIHSYDVLLIALALVGFLAAQLGAGKADWPWVGRVAVIGAGAFPSAGWFLYVLSNDSVFQARAATETYAPHFGSVLAGLLLGIGLAMPALGRKEEGGMRWPSLAALGFLIAMLFALSQGYAEDRLMLSAPLWALAAAIGLATLFLIKERRPGIALVASWAVMGLAAPYFPALFQRKLAMGQFLPWAILAGFALEALLRDKERSRRNVASACAIALVGISSLLWLQREIQFVQTNVSSTTLHPVTLDAEATEVLREIEKQDGRQVVLAFPGIPTPLEGGGFTQPYLPDMNPMVAGLAGKHAYAGHWSETPQYGARRNDAAAFFLEQTSDGQRGEILRRSQATLILAPLPSAYEGLGLADPRTWGEPIFTGRRWALVRPAPP